MSPSHKNPTPPRRRAPRRAPRGSWREKAPGVYELRVSTGTDPATGRRRQLSRTYRGPVEGVEAALTRLLSEADDGALGGSDLTLGQALERWYRLGEDEWSPTTRHEYRRLIDKRLKPALGNRQLRRLRPHELTDYYQGLRASGLSAASVRRLHAILRTALNHAVREGWLPKNPAVSARPPKERRAEIVPPSVSDVRRLITVAEDLDVELAAFVFVASTTGARRGELCALRWTAVDLEGRGLVISRSLVRVATGDLIEKDTKTHGTRRIALDEATVAVLRAHRERMMDRARKAAVVPPADGYVFSPTLDLRGPWFPDHFTDAWRRLRKKAAVTGRLHDLRHFAATMLIAAGVPIRTVSGRLGHAQASTTLNIYAGFVEATDQAAAQLLGELLAPDAKEPPAIEAGGSDDDDGLAGVPAAV